MNRRGKQIIYGVFYLVLFFFAGYGVYVASIRPPESCVDTIKNRDEVEVDCGGAYCQACAIRHLSPIKILPIAIVPAGSVDRVTAFIELQNPNPNYGADSFSYRFDFYGSTTIPIHTETGQTFIYPSAVKFLVFPNLPFSFTQVSATAATSTGISWKVVAEFSAPKTQVSNLKLEIQKGRGVITGVMRNTSDFAILTATINGFVLDPNAKIIGASQTAVQDIVPSEERFFQIIVPFESGQNTAQLTPHVSIEAKR